MKNFLSLITCFIVCIVLSCFRISNPAADTHKPLKVTTWDAFGYYVYLPSIFIYHDYKKLDWLTEADKKYQVTGGDGWQAEKLDNGNYTFKYLGGVAILEMPFFFAGDFVARHSDYAPDGFSPPYQYALGFGVIFYCLLATLLLRKILLLYFKDTVVALTLLLICLATNFIQYAAVDNAQSHVYIFLLYTIVLFTTIRWHQHPKVIWAILTGYVIGLATMSRPTEAVMLFVPLLWNTQNKEASSGKWKQVKQHKNHILFAALGGLLGVLPQLIYWKLSTGSFLYDVGSKWEFLNPHFRVLFGWEKGWFIYTPITVFFIIGMFFVKKFPFRKSVLVFCLLNIWIIIAWDDWRYGGSYATRALVQSYPVFALPFAAFIDKINVAKWKYAVYTLFAYLLFVNIFQIGQYNKTILHYNDMNRRYYSRIYLNPHPTPIDMSLLDSAELLKNEAGYHNVILSGIDTAIHITAAEGQRGTIITVPLDKATGGDNEFWLKITARIKAPGHLWGSYLHGALKNGDSVKHTRVRLFSPISAEDAVNTYSFYMRVPGYSRKGIFELYITGPGTFEGTIENLSIDLLDRK
ncbi:hypothetical protein ACTHGU_15365 [Chitinophagaceae bacterium MMS25-I14]